MAPAAFLSYARDDSEFALHLAEALKAAGAPVVWLDKVDIQPGELWDRAVEAALTRCTRMLLVLSPSSVDSPVVMDEVSFALEGNKTIIPVLYRDCSIPFRLRRVQYIDFRTDYVGGLKELLKTLGTKTLEVQSPFLSPEALEQPEREVPQQTPSDSLGTPRLVSHPIPSRTDAGHLDSVPSSAINPKLEPTPDIVPERLHQLRTPLSQPDRVHLIHAAQGAIGGLIAGIYLAIRYYLRSRLDLSWWLLNSLLEIGFSCVIGTLMGASVLYFMSRFRALYKKAGFLANILLDVIAAGIGGGSTAVLAGILAAITFGLLKAPPASPEDLLIGLSLGTMFICAGVLQSDGNTLRSALASSAVALVLVFCVLFFLFNTFAASQFLQDYFVRDKVYIMVLKGILVGVAAGLLVGVQIELSRQTHWYLRG